MCGIAGIISKKVELKNTEQNLEKFRNVMRHRGPDEEGVWIEDWLGCTHVRLSIVDIANGQQPMYNTDKSVGLVFNGEIYNYKELRQNLKAKGCLFKTESDTEVIIQLFEKYGTASFEMLNGMFAFCLWDYKNGTTYLVRDYIGMKPLYIYEDNEILAFASELKALLQLENADLSLDPMGVQDYLTFRYTHAPHTMFKNIYRLEAGTYIKFKQMRATKFRYWDVSYSPTIEDSQTDYKDQIIDVLDDVVKSQLMGEVPIGVLLSGGVDSSTIAYLIHKNNADLTTFNIGYPEVNEFDFSREVARKFGLKHIEVTTTVDELIGSLDNVVNYLDEPLADPACFPLYKLCEELKKHVTVVLSGEGGDELFSGYPQYLYTAQARYNTNNLYDLFLKQSYYYLDYANYMRDKTRIHNVHRHKKYFNEHCTINGMMGYDLKTWVPENLMMKADKMLMAHSLEGRFPFLDKRIIELAHRIPPQQKLHKDGTTKWILKKAVEPFLPRRIVDRPKMGFTVPVDVLVERLKPTIMDVFNNIKSSPLSDILIPEEISKLPVDYYNNKKKPAMQLWTTFILLYWFEKIYNRR